MPELICCQLLIFSSPPDEEEEFRSFCSNILEPGNQAPPPATIPIASKHLPVKSSSAAEPPRQSTAVSVKAPSLAMATSIKRVKPAYVQTLRPETANVAEDDVRLSYAQLFFNTFNGFEKEDLGEKLRAYCVDDCSMSVKWIGERGEHLFLLFATDVRLCLQCLTNVCAIITFLLCFIVQLYLCN